MVDVRLEQKLGATARRDLADFLRHPSRLFLCLHLPSRSVVPPAETRPDGAMNSWDSCPNCHFWNERLLDACRPEEYRLFAGRGAPRGLVESPS